MEGDRDTEGDGFLKACQIGDHRVKCQRAKMLSKLADVTTLVGPGLPEPRNEVSEQLKVGIVTGLHMLHSGRHLHDALRAPIGSLQRNDDSVGGAQRGETRQRKPWWAVEKDVVVLGRESAEPFGMSAAARR